MKKIQKALTTIAILLCLNYSPINTIPITREEINPIQYNINLIYPNSKEISYGINFDTFCTINNFTPSLETSLIYHSNFNGIEKKGLESKISGKLKYELNEIGVEFGTTFWNGSGELKEFKQQTGIIKLNINDFFISYENDNLPFYWIKLADGYDSFRTATLGIGHKNFSINLNIFTGKRTTRLNYDKNTIQEPYFGEYGEYYKNKIVEEESYPYRSTTLMLNFNDIKIKDQEYTFQIGLESEWIRHLTQNALHKILKVPEFKMMNNNYKVLIGIHSSDI